MIPEGEVGCKFCEKSIYRIFVEHIEGHTLDIRCRITESDIDAMRDWWKRHIDDARVIDTNEYAILDKMLNYFEEHFE